MVAAEPAVDVLMITHRRPHYTALSLRCLLDSAGDSVRVWVWHNGDDQETLDIVRSNADHPKLHRLHVSEENVGLNEPTNWLWRESDADYLGKIDDDCLVPDGWTDALVDVLDADAAIGVLGLWLYSDEDDIPELASRKIEAVDGGFRMLRHPWVQGSGYLMRRECLESNGVLGEGDNFTNYCTRLSEAGWRLGFVFPFVRLDHMDDPRSPNTMLRSNEDMERFLPLSARRTGIRDVAQWEDHIRYGGFLLQHWPSDATSLGGIRGRARHRWTRIMYRYWKRRLDREASSPSEPEGAH